MIPKAIHIGPLTLHLYGLIIAAAIYIGYLLAKKRAPLYKIPQKLFEDPILVTPLILGIIGARLYHVIDYWEIYKNDLPSIINISGGGLGIFGGLLGIFAGVFIIAKVRKLNLLSLLDLLSPSLILAQAMGRIGNWINQEGFGPPTNLPWGVYINPENRPAQFITFTHFHPTFFYEAILDAIFFIILIYISTLHYSSSERSESRSFIKGKFSTSSNNKFRLARGQTFGLYLVLYSLGRFAVEFFRIDTATVGTIKVAQVLSIFAFVVGIYLLFRQKIILWKNK